MAEVIIKSSGSDPTELISLDLVKSHLRVENNDEDELITQYMASAMDYMQSVSGRLFKYTNYTPTIHLYIDKNEKIAQIRRATNLKFSSARYINSDGGFTSMPADSYRYSLEVYPCVVQVIQEPSDLSDLHYEGIYRFTFTGGELVSTLPNQFKIAMLMLVSHYYTNREAEYVGGITTELKEGVRRLMNTVKRF